MLTFLVSLKWNIIQGKYLTLANVGSAKHMMGEDYRPSS